MSIIGGGWKDEITAEERYNEITGSKQVGRTEEELRKDIERQYNDPYLSRSERSDLQDLEAQMSNNDGN